MLATLYNRLCSQKLQRNIVIFFPFLTMVGIAFSNLIFIATIILFFIFYENKKVFKLFNKSFFVYIILLYIFIIFTSTVSEYKNFHSLLKSLSIIKFFLFPIAFLYLYKNDKDVLIKISRISLISIILISADLYFQYIFGFDIFGYKPIFEDRFNGFFGKELIAGSFISNFFLISIFYFFKKINKNRIIYYLYIFFALGAVLITGERLSLIYQIISTLLIILLFEKKNIIKYSLIFFLIFIIIFNYSYNLKFKSRILQMFFYIGISSNITQMDDSFNAIKKGFEFSPWGSHYISAYKIFIDNKFIGVGLKNFSQACSVEKYLTFNSTSSANGCSNHPHNLYLEILSELGIIGLLFFIIFLFFIISKSLLFYNKYNNKYLFLFLLPILNKTIPFLPSGSFFSSSFGCIFFFNLSIFILFINQNK